MKRTISVVLLVCLCLTLMAGCKKEDGPLYSYKDLSEYVEVGNVIGLKYTLEVAPVTDDAVNSFVNSALKEKGYGEEKEITDRAVQNGDTVNIDFVGKKDGVAFEGGTSQGYDLVIGSNSFIEGFEAGLVGATVGETRNLDLKFPENYGKDELNGAAVVFEVKVNSIKATVYPELTDEIVAEISDSKTVAEYLKYANDQVVSANQQTAIKNANDSVWAQAMENLKINKIPDREYKFFEEYAREDYENYAASYGVTLDDLIKQSGLTNEQFEQEIASYAKGYAEFYLANVAIARNQDIEITDAEYATGLENFAKQNNYSSAKEAENSIDTEIFKLSLLAEKVLNYLVENAVEA